MKWTERLGHDDIRPTPMNERSMNFFSTFTLWIAANVVITTVMTGMMFVPDISFSNAMLAIIVGSAIGAIPLALTGNIGIRTGLPTMVITRAAFGQKGAILPALVNTIILIGWSWIQAYMAGLSLNYAVHYTTGYSNINLFVILTELLVVIITIFGHRGVERIEKYISIAMLILSFLVFYKIFTTYDISTLVEMKLSEHPSISTILAFDIVVATAFSWMSTVCDFNRNCRSETSGFWGTYFGYLVASIVAMGLGAVVSGFSIASDMERTYDPTILLAAYGFGLIASIVVFFSVLSTNVMALYSATMSFMNVFPRAGFWKPTLIMGVICTLGALLKEVLMSHFFNFIMLIATLFIPVFAIVLVDYFFIKKGVYDAEDILYDTKGQYRYQKGVNIAAYITYIVGAVFAYYFTYIHPLAVGSTMLTFLLSGAVYWGLMKWTKQISASTNTVELESPTHLEG
ncbi:cytosine permease [Geobacillus sp. G4]|uniref:Allantoin permease n=2 Tax=Geobacillus TaxID=129337 RepID=A0A7U9P6H7_GEOTM|nr:MULTISPECIES: cytosine permease [Geobacillus]AWO75860.1 cytosine permease [Geobacillus thermoleovorans]ESU72523.1 allantoin permease [Geobacillus sp. MAS1]MBW7644107.1 cytosine permease [Geobacillus thermoleovorans]ODA17577.1 allantoin permease [Geobacillus thermoleovorans]OQP11985.1 cytosine permease [Geobacillus thermoleovorans]